MTRAWVSGPDILSHEDEIPAVLNNELDRLAFVVSGTERQSPLARRLTS